MQQITTAFPDKIMKYQTKNVAQFLDRCGFVIKNRNFLKLFAAIDNNYNEKSDQAMS